MEISKETAMRLWTKNFGKDLKAFDFAGREMMKAAYADRNSKYGWNIDHVLPQSKGGKTADYNLVCCHILTNDEKADKFPCFNANGKRFEIVRVQNHYEIRRRGSVDHDGSDDEKDDDDENFLDAAYGKRLIKGLYKSRDKKRFVGEIQISMFLYDCTVLDFIKRIFDKENVSYSSQSYINILKVTITIKNYDMPLKEDISALLDKCVLLNTYLSGYFVPHGDVKNYSIHYGVACYDQKDDMYHRSIRLPYINSSLDNCLYIDCNVVSNTEVSRKITVNPHRQEWYEYDYVYTDTKARLEQSANN